MLNKHNYQNKNIRDFTSDDTIYIQKNERGYTITYLCRFVKFERGIVHGEILEIEPSWARFRTEKSITARLSKCYLYNSSRTYGSCCWFQKDGFADNSD